jgi:KipI family sensor histidine kinase inhibitor
VYKSLPEWLASFQIEHYQIASLNSLIFYFKGNDLAVKNKNVRRFYEALQKQRFKWLVEAVPSYTSCLIEYDLFTLDQHQVLFELLQLDVLTSADSASKSDASGHTFHHIPVWYNPDDSDNDLLLVAEAKVKSVEEIVTLHLEQEYTVYGVGFQPGFAYLGELTEALSMPRLAKPRVKVPKGAVAIADRQTAIYPNVSPGGWHIVGLCPLDLSRKAMSTNPFKLGDKVIFKKIDECQFQALLTEEPERISEQEN